MKPIMHKISMKINELLESRYNTNKHPAVEYVQNAIDTWDGEPDIFEIDIPEGGHREAVKGLKSTYGNYAVDPFGKWVSWNISIGEQLWIIVVTNNSHRSGAVLEVTPVFQ